MLLYNLLLGDIILFEPLLKFLNCFASVRDLYNEWTIELKGMADRIISMRQQLFDALRSRGLPLLNFLCNLFCLYLSVWSCITIVSPIYQTFLFTHSLLLKK